MTETCALALEASSDRLSLAARCGARVEYFEVMPARKATAAVYEHARQLLGRLGAGFADLDYVAFGCGPGSFTGVRVAAAVAQALGYSCSIPVCRISSLAVLAAAAGPGLHAICSDARMGRAYAGLYRVGPVERVGTALAAVPAPVMPEALVDPLTFTFPGKEPFTALGDGWQAWPVLRGRHESRLLAACPELLPSARDLLSMADLEFSAGRVVAPADALPEYLGQAPASRPATAE